MSCYKAPRESLAASARRVIEPRAFGVVRFRKDKRDGKLEGVRKREERVCVCVADTKCFQTLIRNSERGGRPGGWVAFLSTSLISLSSVKRFISDFDRDCEIESVRPAAPIRYGTVIFVRGASNAVWKK